MPNVKMPSASPPNTREPMQSVLSQLSSSKRSKPASRVPQQLRLPIRRLTEPPRSNNIARSYSRN